MKHLRKQALMIQDIYKTIEKFYYADKNKTTTKIDETLERTRLYIQRFEKSLKYVSVDSSEL